MNATISNFLTSPEFMDKLTSHFSDPTAEHYDNDLGKMDPINATDGCDVLKMEKPPAIILTKQGTTIEMGFRLPGFIVEKDLPPIEKLPKKCNGMRQYVTVSGMGNEIFNVAIKNSMSIHDFFGRKVAEGALPDWTPETYQGYPSLSFSCRYLARKGDGPVVEFGPGVDPKGLLAKAGPGFIHTAENSVGYFFRQDKDLETDQSPYYYGVTTPVIFRIGHIVELHVSYCLRPARTKGKWYLSQTLRSVTMLDCSIDKAILNERIKAVGTFVHPEFPLRVKRVLGVPMSEDAAVVLARKQMRLLDISGRSNKSHSDGEETLENEGEGENQVTMG